MNSIRTILIAAIGLGLWLGGCKVKNEGSLSGDQPPTTSLAVAPAEGSVVNYYISLGWSGNDRDGTIAGFRIYIDSVYTGFTTAHDTTMAFTSPGDSVATPHSFSVQAVDDAGLLDPHPPVRHFSTINRTPSATFGAGGISNHDSLGTAFRVTISSTSPRPSSAQYSVAVDDPNAWSAWSNDSVFAFAAPELLGDTLFPDGVTGISNAALTPGVHVIFIRAQNAGGAVSNVAADTVTIATGAGFLPVMDTTVTTTYGSGGFYPDGSAYYVQATGQEISVGFAAHVPHKGEINAYRWRRGTVVNDTSFQWSDTWGPWQHTASIDTTDLPPGTYPFQFMARDLANHLTEPDSFIMRLVQQNLSDSVIIAADTKNVTSVQIRISQSQVNAFYRDSLLAHGGVTKTRVVQVTLNDSLPDPSRHGEAYLSPYDVRNAGLVIWHMEDPSAGSDTMQARRIQILGDYLSKGGRIVLSGWNVISKFQPVTSDTLVFASNSYAVNYLKVFSGWKQGSPFQVIGYDGVNGFPQVRVDSTKIAAGLHGRLNNCWTFDTQGQNVVTGLLATADSTTNRRYHRPSSYVYNLSFRVAVFGVPLYLCRTSEVQALFVNSGDPTHGILSIMTEGLAPTP